MSALCPPSRHLLVRLASSKIPIQGNSDIKIASSHGGIWSPLAAPGIFLKIPIVASRIEHSLV
jgi:hypothetical protein